MQEWLYNNEWIKWVFSGIGLAIFGLIVSLIAKFRIPLFEFIREKILKHYRWEANPPLQNRNKTIYIKDHPISWGMSNSELKDYVEGKNAFIQSLYFFI